MTTTAPDQSYDIFGDPLILGLSYALATSAARDQQRRTRIAIDAMLAKFPCCCECPAPATHRSSDSKCRCDGCAPEHEEWRDLPWSAEMRTLLQVAGGRQ